MARHGVETQCKFEYNPSKQFIQIKSFESKSTIDPVVANIIHLNSFVLRLKDDNDSVLIEKRLEKTDQRITIGDSFHTFSHVRASIDVDTQEMDKKMGYKCCLEYANEKNSKSLCVILKFDHNKTNPIVQMMTTHEFFTSEKTVETEQLMKITRINEENKPTLLKTFKSKNQQLSDLNEMMQQNMFYLIGRDFLVGFIIITTFGILLTVLVCKIFEMRKLCVLRKQQQILMGNGNSSMGINGSLHTIQMPLINPVNTVATSSPYDELYVKYNLNTSQINYNEVPPAYENCYNDEKKY